MSTTTNVEFYEKVKKLQDRQHDSEKRRMELDHQLNSYVKSDHRMARLKAIRLQNYWKKICEDEKRSQCRNEQLLRDFDRVESHMVTLNARTEKLRAMKKQYEEYIERAYPNWKERILHNQRLQHHVDRQQQLQVEAQAQAQVERSMAEYHSSSYSVHQAGTALPVSSHTLTTSQQHYQHIDSAMGDRNKPVVPASNAAVPSPAYGYVSLPDQSADYRISSTLPPHSSPGYDANHRLDPMSGTSPRKGYNEEDNDVVKPVRVVAADVTAKAQHKPEPLSMTQKIEHVRDDDIDDEDDEKKKLPRQQAPKVMVPGTDNTDDFDTDMSFTLSEQNDAGQPTRPTDRAQTPDSVYLQPDITLEGLYNLFTAIEGELPATRHISSIYQSDRPEPTVIKEIISNANRGSMLSHMNSSSLSMVVLDQLPLLVINMEESCVIPDSILYKPSAVATEQSIRGNIHPTSQPFWDRLINHLLHLLKYNVLDPSHAAEIFAPLLIAEDSPYEAGAITLLTTILEGADIDVIKSPMSTSTFSTLSPRKRPDDDNQRPISSMLTGPDSPQLKHEVIAEVEHESGDHEDDDHEDDDDDDFFNQSVPDIHVPLTRAYITHSSRTSMDIEIDFIPFKWFSNEKTSAYKQLLGGAGTTMSTTQNTVTYEDSDDSDDVEAQLGAGISSKSDKPRPSQSDVVAVKVPSAEMGTVSPQGDSRVSSPSLGSTGGYVPSALDTDKKSGTGSLTSSGKSAKKGPAFLGDSDTDEDIDIKGTQPNEEKDDFFDFYG